MSRQAILSRWANFSPIVPRISLLPLAALLGRLFVWMAPEPCGPRLRDLGEAPRARREQTAFSFVE
jgi:hypothetical protein